MERLDNAPGAINDRLATVGRVLFYDRKLSLNDTTPCSSCHEQALGFSDARRFSIGFSRAAVTSAHSSRLGDVRYFSPGTMFWNHYDSRIRNGPALDDRLRNGGGFNLSGAEKAALVAFLCTLNDLDLTTDPRFSNPFR